MYFELKKRGFPVLIFRHFQTQVSINKFFYILWVGVSCFIPLHPPQPLKSDICKGINETKIFSTIFKGIDPKRSLIGTNAKTWKFEIQIRSIRVELLPSRDWDGTEPSTTTSTRSRSVQRPTPSTKVQVEFGTLNFIESNSSFLSCYCYCFL